MEAKLYGQNKGGMSINGIIKDYYAYAGEQISAGDLVEYVNGVAGKTDYGESVDTQLSTETYTGYKISAVALDENRVFIVHRNSNNYLSGLVCTISGATITVGTDTQLPTSTVAYEAFSICLLQNGNVFVAYRDNSTGSTNQYLYGIVVSINGTTITTGGKTSLVTTKNSGHTISTCLLPNGNVFIAHCYSNNYYLNGIVVSIDGTTITKGTDTALVSSNYAGYTISTCLLPNGNVFIAHSNNSNYYLYGIVCTISGTTITAGSDTAINSDTTYTGSVISTCLLSNGNVFIAHSRGSNSKDLYGIVCTISGTTITKGTDTELSKNTGSGDEITTVALNENKVLIIHDGAGGSSGAHYVSGMIIGIEETVVKKISEEILINKTGTYPAKVISTVKLDNGTIFVAHNYTNDYYLYAQIFGIDYENNIPTNNISITEYETQVRKVTTGQFDGIAKTSGEGGDDTGHKDIVSIWTKVPVVTQEVTMADGNTLADANGDIFLVREEK